jgi:hypothetical protein
MDAGNHGMTCASTARKGTRRSIDWLPQLKRKKRQGRLEDARPGAATKGAGWSAVRIQSKRRQGTSGGMRCCAALLLAAAGC